MRKWTVMLLAVLVLLSASACGAKAPDDAAAGQSGAQEDTASVSGVVNRLGDYLVLLTDDEAYVVFDFGEEVDPEALEEGDRVTVTYTGELESEDPAPVAVSIEAEQAS